jgi:PAS domain S-box-containing protein
VLTKDGAQEIQTSGGNIEQLLELHSGVLAISSELDLDRLLQQIVETARSFTHSHYAALGVVGDDGLIDVFFTSGISKEQREQMGELPRGHGLLGVLIKEGKPIRIPNISKDPRSVGFPPNHPLMITLLGMPIRYMGRVVGDLYLTDKDNGELWSDEDEWLTSMLANHAAVAIGNAYLYGELQEQRERAEADRKRLIVILENLPEGVLVCDVQGNITMLNAKATQMMGFALGGNVHRRPFVTKYADGSAYEDRELPLSRTLAFGDNVGGQHIVVQLPERDDAIDVLNSTAPLLDSDGRLAGAVVVYQDISAIKAVERLKDDFFSMATHELRTPLTSITMSAGLLAELVGGQGGKVAGLARLVDDSAQRMRRLVDDLLDLSRLEHGRLTLYRRDFNLEAVIEHASEEIAPLVERKGQRLAIQLPEGGCQVNADATRIEQIILNLLANAVKYTPEGGRISLSVSQDEAETVVTVADNGPGVSEDDRERIFERFFRSKQDATSATGGTGLGLPIARMLVELHGGRVWLEDAPGGGSVFRFTIPAG